MNLTGTFLVTQVIGGEMASRGRGSVVNIGSLYASVSPDQRFYDHLTGIHRSLRPRRMGRPKPQW